MAELAQEEIFREIELADAQKIRARNYVLGRYGFTDGQPDPSGFAQAAEFLGALGLNWREPPGLLPIQEMPCYLEVDPKARGLSSRQTA